MYRNLRTEGVVLSQKNFAEADRLLTIYTRDFGKLHALAKGVRRPKSKKAGHTQLGNWCKMLIVRGKSLDLITEIETKRAFGFENLSVQKAVEIYHFLELVNLLTAQNQKNIQIFSLLVNFLKKLDGGYDYKLLSAVFKIKLISNLGFFSAENLKDSNLKVFLKFCEEKDFDSITTKIDLSEKNHLKLSLFLDSMIENAAERKLKTSRFLNG